MAREAQHNVAMNTLAAPSRLALYLHLIRWDRPAGTYLLLLVQPQELQDVLFEAASALGTVGLSRGITPDLTAMGKLIVVGLMFVGRVGPLTLFLLLAGSSRDQPWQLPDEDVAVG